MLIKPSYFSVLFVFSLISLATAQFKPMEGAEPIPPGGMPPNPIKKCLGFGTRITIFDGSSKSIESLQVGEQVLSATSLLDIDFFKMPKLFISLTTKSEAANEMYKLTDDLNHQLFLTGNHPVFVQNRGFVQAIQLKKGDILFTLDGLSKVESIERANYQYPFVFNLLVSGENVNTFTNSFFAERILVGDLQRQSSLEAK